MSARVVIVGRRRAAIEAAARAGHTVAVVDAQPTPAKWGAAASFSPGDGLVEAVRAWRPEVIAASKEGAVLPAAELRGALALPGLSVEAARRCTDKVEMKAALRRAGVPVTAWRADTDGLAAAALVEALGLPMVVKQRASSGSRGTTVVRERDDARPLLHGWMAEAWVEGTEMSAEGFVVGGEVVWWNPTQYLVPAWSSLLPAALPAETAAAVERRLRETVRALGVTRGMVHLECFLRPGGVVVSEMAARPPGGHLMPLIERAYGTDPWAAWLAAERGVDPAVPDRAERVAAAWLLHPGPGRVTAAECPSDLGREGVEVEARLRVKPGDVLGPRHGTGQEAGHLIATGADAESVAAAIREAAERVRIETSLV